MFYSRQEECVDDKIINFLPLLLRCTTLNMCANYRKLLRWIAEISEMKFHPTESPQRWNNGSKAMHLQKFNRWLARCPENITVISHVQHVMIPCPSELKCTACFHATRIWRNTFTMYTMVSASCLSQINETLEGRTTTDLFLPRSTVKESLSFLRSMTLHQKAVRQWN